VSAGAPAVGTDGGTVLGGKASDRAAGRVALASAVITPGQYTSLVTIGVLIRLEAEDQGAFLLDLVVSRDLYPEIRDLLPGGLLPDSRHCVPLR